MTYRSDTHSSGSAKAIENVLRDQRNPYQNG